MRACNFHITFGSGSNKTSHAMRGPLRRHFVSDRATPEHKKKKKTISNSTTAADYILKQSVHSLTFTIYLGIPIPNTRVIFFFAAKKSNLIAQCVILCALIYYKCSRLI